MTGDKTKLPHPTATTSPPPRSWTPAPAYYPWVPPSYPYPTQSGWVNSITPWLGWPGPMTRPAAPPSSRPRTRSDWPSTPRPGYGQAHLMEYDALQPTDIGSAFQAMSLQPSAGEWVMDIGATSHLTSDAAYMPHMSLLYADLTEDEKKKAQERANSLDDSIGDLSFTVKRVALYKTDTEDKTLKSWEKVAEYELE